MRVRYCWPLVIGLLLVTRAHGDRKELAKLGGVWLAAYATRDGKDLPKEEVKKLVLFIKGDSYTFTMGKELSKGKLEVDPTTKPKSLDATRTEGPMKDTT